MATDGLIFGPAPFLTLFCGAKHSGKTQCIKYVCRAYAHIFASIIVFCPTALTGAYDFLPKKYVFDAPVICNTTSVRLELFDKVITADDDKYGITVLVTGVPTYPYLEEPVNIHDCI